MATNKKYPHFISALEKVYVPRLENAGTFVLKFFVSDLKKHGLQVAQSNLSTLLINEKLTPLLQQMYKRAGLFGARSQYNQLTASITKQKAAGFGRNEQWIREVLQYLQLNILEFAAAITDTLKADILRIVSEGVEQGWSIDKIVDSFQSTGIIRSRARVIARTEIVRAANVGHAAGARSFPYEVNKKWIAARDHRTRHSHRQVNNLVTDENGTFKVPIYRGDKPTGQYDAMIAPGDPKASASNTINCRCRVIYEAKRDGKGQLIRRSTFGATIIPLRPQSGQTLPNIAASAQAKALAAGIIVDVERGE